MEDSMIAIAVISSLVFFGVLIWKAVWLIRKVSSADDEHAANDNSTDD